MNPSAKPNVVFILADNLGWGDLGCYGGTVATPRIDSIAADGLRLDNYTVEAQCTPTRSALLTGRLPVRSGTSIVPMPGQAGGLAPWEYTLAQLFSDAGYATAAYGKWHLGEEPGRLPTDQGFDEWFGIKNSSDEAGYSAYEQFRALGEPEPQEWEGVRGEPVRPVGVFDKQAKDLGDEKITQRTIGFIERQAKAHRPFFVYVAMYQVHPPMGVHPDFVRKSGGGIYADSVAELDHRTGQILDALDRAGVADDTIVVFSSDNATSPLAGAHGGSNGPWRGDFFTPPYEGSYRTAAVIRWPGRIPAGRRSQEMFCAVDWLPTFAGIIGESGRVPTDRPIDGIDAAEHLLGRRESSGRDSVLYFGIDGRLMSVKWKNYKVIFRTSDGIDRPITDVQMPLVFDLIGDPGERFNIWEHAMDVGWVFRPVYGLIKQYQQSVAKYRNIETGEDFPGYR
ncbi:arylsulfatase [Catellatospora chokoriensis]|uniref:Arylsulfatase n=1 Tax=Catellatospora chokoriensis TaxID=310353 RepID=A0A8J3JZP2_9ACTN|nr:arylsulfatase [Catellatospora chokoriensis]GIF94056.1 arylsulfatase [Catellatospora chokoriensis]